jgi:hypothetical protein
VCSAAHPHRHFRIPYRARRSATRYVPVLTRTKTHSPSDRPVTLSVPTSSSMALLAVSYRVQPHRHSQTTQRVPSCATPSVHHSSPTKIRPCPLQLVKPLALTSSSTSPTNVSSHVLPPTLTKRSLSLRRGATRSAHLLTPTTTQCHSFPRALRLVLTYSSTRQVTVCSAAPNRHPTRRSLSHREDATLHVQPLIPTRAPSQESRTASHSVPISLSIPLTSACSSVPSRHRILWSRQRQEGATRCAQRATQM